jgi:hypothetical protein
MYSHIVFNFLGDFLVLLLILLISVVEDGWGSKRQGHEKRLILVENRDMSSVEMCHRRYVFLSLYSFLICRFLQFSCIHFLVFVNNRIM